MHRDSDARSAAAGSATGHKVSLTLLGIKAVRAFDGRVIIAAVEARSEGKPQKLLGAQVLTEGDLPPAGALTVLAAVNRILYPYLSGEEELGEAAGD